MSSFSLCLYDENLFMHICMYTYLYILFTFGWRHHPLGADQTSRFRDSKFYWILSYNMSLEGSIDFLVLLVSKLWPNNANQLGKSPLIPYAREFLKYLEFLVITLATRNARKSIKHSKDSYNSLEPNKSLSHEIGSLDRWWRHKKLQNMPQSWRHRPKTPNPKLKIFFILN